MDNQTIEINSDNELVFVDLGFAENAEGKTLGKGNLKLPKYIKITDVDSNTLSVSVVSHYINVKLREYFSVTLTEIFKHSGEYDNITVGKLIFQSFIKKVQKQEKYKWVKRSLSKSDTPISTDFIKSLLVTY